MNVATCSNGDNYSGKHANRARARNEQMRRRLQAKRTKSVKRLLKKRHRKGTRFVTDTNHKIAYRIVREAERTGQGIDMETLHGIRDRIRARRPQRRTTQSWSYFQLQQFVTYKATLAGVPAVLVDPRNTSRRCPMCHYADKRYRRSRDWFCCHVFGLAGPADLIASVNIAFLGSAELGRGEVAHPDAGVQSGFNRSSQHLDHGGDKWRPDRASEKRPGRCEASCTRQDSRQAGNVISSALQGRAVDPGLSNSGMTGIVRYELNLPPE